MSPGKDNKQKLQKTVRLDDVHWKLLEGLTPFYGSSEPEVVRNIVLMWLHDNLGSGTIEELKKTQSIRLGNRNKDGVGSGGK